MDLRYDEHRYMTYIPIPTVLDPSTVDFKTFYSYIPNEVKHRKRTTRAQFKVLEETFHHDQKPNANIRRALAAKLEMTPRAVQVWFQNRRAKDKLQLKKASQAAGVSSAAAVPSPDLPGSDLTEPADSVKTEQQDASPPHEDSSRPSTSSATFEDLDDVQSQFAARRASVPGIAPQHLPAAATKTDLLSPHGAPAALRRGSLPAVGPSRVLDPVMARRLSLDPISAPSLLGGVGQYHQYGGAMIGVGSFTTTPPQNQFQLPQQRLHKPELTHRASLPIGVAGYSRLSRVSSSPGFPQQQQQQRYPHALPQLPYAPQPRLQSAPIIAGPLPNPDFSFGSADVLTTPTDSSSSAQEDERDDISANFSYEGFNHSRFGSFASVDSDTTAASLPASYYSASSDDFVSEDGIVINGGSSSGGVEHWVHQSRRPSLPGQVVNMFSNLEVIDDACGAQQQMAPEQVYDRDAEVDLGMALEMGSQGMDYLGLGLETAAQYAQPQPRSDMGVKPHNPLEHSMLGSGFSYSPPSSAGVSSSHSDLLSPVNRSELPNCQPDSPAQHDMPLCLSARSISTSTTGSGSSSSASSRNSGGPGSVLSTPAQMTFGFDYDTLGLSGLKGAESMGMHGAGATVDLNQAMMASLSGVGMEAAFASMGYDVRN